jgi:NAD(P)-dependent dehydrogenase (short-subunit alcohol dehydrogenase family)
MNQYRHLAGRVAIVTGGARGIGLAITEALYEMGATVVVADSGVSISGENPDPSVAQGVAARLGARASAFGEDLCAAGSPRRAVEFAVDTFGSIDIVVNNAAILRDALIFKAEQADWDRVIENNLSVPFALLAAATPRMREQQKNGRVPGRIVNMVSSAGLFGNFGQSAYASAKAGLFGLTRVVAMELARARVACNAIAPFAATRVTDSIRPANETQTDYKRRALTIPAHYVARLTAFLCSNLHDVTGQLFGVRGRELFVFSQPRPVGRALMKAGPDTDFAGLSEFLGGDAAGKLTDLATDLEFFSSEPLV